MELPAPYSMCTRQECELRQATGEISLLERRSKTMLDPRRAVTKYRRSAAGTTDRVPPRTLLQLETSLSYLQDLLVVSTPLQFGYLLVVEFVLDRLRAMQVELTQRQSNLCSDKDAAAQSILQVGIIRTLLLIRYLMVDVPQVEHKFVENALQAALSAYWNHQQGECDDEVLSWTLLLQGTSSEEDNGKNLSSFYHLYRRHHHHAPASGPLFQSTLQFVAAWQSGDWGRVWRLAQKNDYCQRNDTNHPVVSLVLWRCLLAPKLSYVQYKALEAFNVTWGKAEVVSFADLERLLGLTPTSRAAACLPSDDKGLTFKAAPLQELPSTPSIRAEWDDFCWGGDANSRRQVPLGSRQQQGSTFYLPPVAVLQNLFLVLPE